VGVRQPTEIEMGSVTYVEMLIQSVVCVGTGRVGRGWEDVREFAHDDDIRSMSTAWLSSKLKRP